jgi:tripartite-type tricarboxylate transporter receptor subunit TctC
MRSDRSGTAHPIARALLSRARRSIALLALLHAAWMLTPIGNAGAQTAGAFPAKPVRIVVPFPAGGPVDLSARTLAPRLMASFGQPVLVDNRPGAATIIGTDLVAKSPPDGYTWLITTNGIAINPSVYKKLPYDTSSDLAAVTMLSKSPFILIAHPSLPVRTAADLIKLARSRPGELMYSSSGVGSANHLPVALLNIMAGIKTTHVPYKGTVPSLGAVTSGEVHFQFSNPVASLPLARAGKVRVLATGGLNRLPSMPDLPTVSESAVRGFEAGPWFGVFTAASTPPDMIKRMQSELQRTLALQDVKRILTAEGAELIGNSPEAFAAQMRSDIAKWAKVVKAAGVTAE